MKLGNIKKQLVPAAGLVGGAVAAGYVTKFVPVANEKIKAAAPVVLGLLLMGQKGMVGSIGAGMLAGGGLKLAQSFGIGAIEDPIMALDYDYDYDDDGVNGFDSPVSGLQDDTEEKELD